MKVTFLLAATAAGVFAMSALAQAQDMQMSPAQGGAAQQSAQGAGSATNDSSYGGAMSTTKASGASRDAWTSTSQLCTPGLSCNIYSGQ
ncbi:hypothetical protein BTHE68_53670 [Burkholderia sp. THE68]|uniref:hypothetical protein n=1 Tax=Burkholderia sp. THE68 TaxID=758782 RepID=UPI0013169127|nr:hypothetical protein [Burkholderia sp. THE68]BBU31633.1 hypothetical protein BTHE68_53670 [Burkholderia sp. THE68]